jgi:hypothetical protein
MANWTRTRYGGAEQAVVSRSRRRIAHEDLWSGILTTTANAEVLCFRGSATRSILCRGHQVTFIFVSSSTFSQRAHVGGSVV